MSEQELIAERERLLGRGEIEQADIIQQQILTLNENTGDRIEPQSAQQPLQVDPALVYQDIKASGHPDPSALMAQIELYGSEKNFTGISPSLAEDIPLEDIASNFQRAVQVDAESYAQFGGRRKARAYFLNGSLKNPDRKKIKAIESRAKEIEKENDPKAQYQERRKILEQHGSDIIDEVLKEKGASFNAELQL